MQQWFLVCLLLMGSLSAEVEQVTLRWRAKNCDESCEEKIKERLLDIDAVAEVSIVAGAGQAVLKWKPNAPFSYSPLNIAMRRVGPSLYQVWLVVRGNIETDGKDVILTSIGDNTKFTLLNPVEPQETGLAVEGTTRGRELPEALRNQLIETQKSGQSVTVKGPIFMPFRSPQMLIIESVSVHDTQD